MKKWINSYDGRPRARHAAMDEKQYASEDKECENEVIMKNVDDFYKNQPAK
jgi:hypothetical protein